MTVPTFINVRLNDSIEQGATGGPDFLTTVMALNNGKEKRNGEWQYPRQAWDISYGIQSKEDFAEIEAMFFIARGRLVGFRFKDWSDYQIGDAERYVAAAAQSIGTGAAGNQVFQCYKQYTLGPYNFQRKITRLVTDTLKVYLNGTLKTETADYTVDYDTGLITFVSAPADGVVVSISTEFDVPVRFDSDSLKKKVTWAKAEELPSIAIIELKDE